MTKRNAVIYCRVACASQMADDPALLAQEKECRAYAATHDLTVTSIFHDAGISGLRTDRPGWQDMMQCLQKITTPHSVLVADETRLARDNHLSGTLQHECKQLGHTVVFANVPSAL